MKIAIFTDTYFPEQVNGVAKVAARQAEVLAQRGHDVRVWSVQNVPSLPFWGYRGERFALPIGRAVREARIWSPDIIHAHTPFSLGWEAVRVARARHVPLVGTHHTFFDHYLKHVKLDMPLSRLLSWKYLTLHYNRYDLVLSPSQSLLRGMRAHGLTAATKHLPNGIDTDYFSPPPTPRTGRTFIYMGRVSYEKSIDRVIESFASVAIGDAEARLVIVGDGPERRRLERLASERGVADRVAFTGMLHGVDLLQALWSADIFVTASKSENMPLSVLEAMSTGLPVVAVRALGIPEIVRDGVEGCLVEPDDVPALAQAMSGLLQDAEARHRYGAAARERALAFGEAEYGRQLEEVYTALIQQTL